MFGFRKWSKKNEAPLQFLSAPDGNKLAALSYLYEFQDDNSLIYGEVVHLLFIIN